MSVAETATEVTGFHNWRGHSAIHCSTFASSMVQLDAMGTFRLAKQLAVERRIWRYLQKNFSKFEWLVTQSQFEARALVDWYNHAVGKGDSQDETKLKNPVTGNVFHRVAVHEAGGLVAGIRFWIDQMAFGRCDIGFRFRIQQLEETTEKVRIRAAEQGVEDANTLAEIEVELATMPPQVFEEGVPEVNLLADPHYAKCKPFSGVDSGKDESEGDED